MGQRKGAYAPEFRQQMVELVRAGRKPSELAKEFGCHDTSIGAWVRQANADELGGGRADAPPRWRNQREPTACDTPTASAAFSLVTPVATSFQNRRSISFRCDGAPGERIAPRPVTSCIHPAGRPINTSIVKGVATTG